MTHALQQLGGVTHGPLAFRIDRFAGCGARDQTDPQATGRGADLLRERPLRWRRKVRRPDIGTAGHVQQCGAVAHAARDDVLGGHARPAFATIGAVRIARARRLEPEQSAARGRDADRSATVRGVGGGHDPGGDRSCRAAAGAAGHVVEIPRIARGAMQPGLGGDGEAELGRIGLAEDVETAALVARHQLGVVIGTIVGEEAAAVAGDGTGEQRVQILEEERHPVERALRQAGAQRGARLIVVTRHHRVDARIDGFGARDRRIEQLAPRTPAAPAPASRAQWRRSDRSPSWRHASINIPDTTCAPTRPA